MLQMGEKRILGTHPPNTSYVTMLRRPKFTVSGANSVDWRNWPLLIAPHLRTRIFNFQLVSTVVS